MKKSFSLTLLAALAVWISQVVDVLAKPICGIEFQSPAQVEAVLSVDKKLPAKNDDPMFATYFDKANSIVWAFSSKLNPSYPAVVCRQIVVENGTYHINMDIRCGSTQESCDQLSASFNDLNKRTIETMKANVKPKQ